MGNNLKRLRKDRGWTHQKVADEMGVSRSQLIKLERGERRLTEDYISQAARAFQVDEAEIIADRRTVPLVGYVGAGAEAHFYAEGQAPLEDVPAPPNASDDTVAVQIRGASMGALFDHWVVFYDDIRSPLTRDMIGKVCVIGLEDDRVLIKQLQNGGRPHTYTLVSSTEPPIYDVRVAWGAVVTGMAPR